MTALLLALLLSQPPDPAALQAEYDALAAQLAELEKPPGPFQLARQCRATWSKAASTGGRRDQCLAYRG